VTNYRGVTFWRACFVVNNKRGLPNSACDDMIVMKEFGITLCSSDSCLRSRDFADNTAALTSE